MFLCDECAFKLSLELDFFDVAEAKTVCSVCFKEKIALPMICFSFMNNKNVKITELKIKDQNEINESENL